MTTHTGSLTDTDTGPAGDRLIEKLNTRWHEKALWAFGAIVLFHWVEHLTQAFQVWVLQRPSPESRGFLGQYFPWLVTSEAMHFGFALVMLVGLIVLRPGFTGQARAWWTVALAIQAFHLVEHGLLQIQAVIGVNFFGAKVPTSIVQNFAPRVELHLFYNLIVFVPMVVAMILHTRPGSVDEAQLAACSCALRKAS